MKGLRDIGGRRVVITLSIKLACTSECAPRLKISGNDTVQQGLLGMAGVVKLGGRCALRWLWATLLGCRVHGAA